MLGSRFLGGFRVRQSRAAPH